MLILSLVKHGDSVDLATYPLLSGRCLVLQLRAYDFYETVHFPEHCR